MKNYQFFGVIKYAITGFILGILLIIIGVLLNYNSGFHGAWFHIFDYAPDFVIIAFSPIFLSLLFYLFGFRREQYEISTQQIKSSLFNEQKINSVSDQQLKVLAKVVAQVNEAIIITDCNGKVEWINEGFTKINGFILEEVKGKELNNVIYGSITNKEVIKRIAEKLIIGESVMEELQTYNKNGTPIWLSLSIKPIFDDTGEIVNFISIQNNITSRKGKEISIEALYKEVANYKFALDQSAIVMIFNIHGKIIHINRKFCEINELAEDELLGNDYRSISISMRDKSIVNPIWKALQEGNTWKGELVNRNKNGKLYWADTTIVPLIDAAGMPYQFLAIQHDITERKELEIQLIANKNKLHQAMQIAQLGSWELYADGKFILSTELRQLYHFPLEGDILIDEFFNNIHTQDVDIVKEKIALSQNSLQLEEVEYRYYINGVLHYIISNIYPHLDVTGNCIGAFGTVQDNTAAKLSALALKKSETEKSVILNNTQTVICLHDMNGVIIDINNTAERMSGFSKNEIIGLSLKLIISPEYTTEFDEYIHTINNNPTANGIFNIYTKNGNKKVWLYQNTVYANEGNQPYVIASAIDITESVKAQNEVERQQQFIRQIINNSPSVIFMINAQRQIMLANKTFANYYPYNEKETPFAKKLSHGAEDIFFGDMDSLFEMEDGQMITLEGSLNNPATDTSCWFNIINKCFKEKNGEKYILGFGMDITGRHQVETDLIAANEMVKKTLKVKDAFISNMSHEIRTPLNAVIGFTDLLLETSLNSKQAAYVDIVKTASGNLLALINNILVFTKIESSNLVLESHPMSIIKIINDVIKILEPQATVKGISVTKMLDDTLPPIVLGDPLRLSQVLFNIIENAVKFTDTGTIDITCKLVNEADKLKDHIAFSIRDSGIGVANEKQTDIFERFTQGNQDTQLLYGALGLELSIAKRIVELYGGTFTIEIDLDKGTTFNFMLPFNKCIDTPYLNELKSVNGERILSINKAIRILLVEDNSINAMLATQVLTKRGFTLVHVLNGQLAVEAVQQQYFDLILMDIQMPVMDGIEATKTIRQLNGTVANIPIIAMTAHSLHGKMQHCYNTGMNGYVAKPFKARDLFNSISEVIKSSSYNNAELSSPIIV